MLEGCKSFPTRYGILTRNAEFLETISRYKFYCFTCFAVSSYSLSTHILLSMGLHIFEGLCKLSSIYRQEQCDISNKDNDI